MLHSGHSVGTMTFRIKFVLKTVDENLRLVFWLITQKKLVLESKFKPEVKTIGQEL